MSATITVRKTVPADLDTSLFQICISITEWSPYRRQDTGRSAMHKHIHSEAEEDPTVCGIRLYTDEDNRGARRTYETVGMNGYMMEFFETDFVYGPRPT